MRGIHLAETIIVHDAVSMSGNFEQLFDDAVG
jgi:hypothetical protein